MSSVLALRRQRQGDLHELEDSLVYRASSRTAKAVSKQKQNKNKQTNKKQKRKERQVKKRKGWMWTL